MRDSAEDLDRILERGIASYPDAEPLAGMEERILARIDTAKAAKGGIGGWWTILALGLASMVIAGLVFVRPKPAPTPSRRTPVAIAKVNLLAPLDLSPQRPRMKRVHQVRALPKGPVFPTPSPLTTEERLMAAFASKSPEAAAQAFDSLRAQMEKPIDIAPIEIPPISETDEQ